MRCLFKNYCLGAAAALSLVCIGAGTPSYACFSGLVVIPTADTVGDGQYGVEYQMDGETSTPRCNTQIINTEFGFGDKMEIGVDFNESNNAAAGRMLNAKYVLTKLDASKTSIAAGVCGVAHNLKSNPYLVATKDMQGYRLHFGGMQIDENNRWFAGIDRPLNDKLVFMADYTNGQDNYSSLGLSYQLDKSKSLLAGIEFPNSSGESIFSIHFVMNGSTNELLKGKK